MWAERSRRLTNPLMHPRSFGMGGGTRQYQRLGCFAQSLDRRRSRLEGAQEPGMQFERSRLC
eukprot:COSAG03_NODE_24490_length_272_cov_0.589595_1_plen_61_part_10